MARLSVRLIRRGVLLLAMTVAGYAALEVVAYEQAYPDAAARAMLATLADNPAVRMLQGVPHAVTTPGGYFAWDGGWLLAALVGVWALLTTSRLLRGEEEAGRTDMLLAGPLPASRAVAVPLIVLGVAAALVGAAAVAALILSGTGTAGSVLFGAGLAGFAATSAGIAAVSAQVFSVRRRALGVAGMLLGAFFLLRMAGNSSDSWGWLRWFTPFGWMDDLHAYGDNRWPGLIPLLLAPVVLGVLAVRLRGVRDTGAGVLAASDSRAEDLRLLDSPVRFALRSTRGVLLAWLVSLAAYSFLTGCLVKTVTEFLADPAYRNTMESFGIDVAQTARGYLAVMSGFLGLAFVLYAIWRIGAARAEESAGRLDLILTRPVARWRWLGGHALLTVAGAGLLPAVSGVATWLGSVITGANVTLEDALAATLNLVPVVALFAGLAVAVYGVAPRLTVGVPAGAAALSYLLGLLGPALKWPEWLVGISPFSHLAMVPADPFAVAAAAVMVAAGITGALLGIAAFSRRDLTGG